MRPCNWSTANALGTDEYIQLSRMLNSEPLLVIQTGMHQGRGARTPEEWEPFVVEACEWIEYCNGPATSKWGAVRAANGHPEPYNVKLWEIDNELWRSRVTDPAVYAEAVNWFSKRMKAVDPSITVIAHGGNGTDRRYNVPVVNNAAENFSVLSIHHYTDADKFISGKQDHWPVRGVTVRPTRPPGIGGSSCTSAGRRMSERPACGSVYRREPTKDYDRP